jgi:predicted RNA-binding protein YlxR (DUF448 family)
VTENQGPHRQCIGCRRTFPKKDLLRFFRSASGSIEFDEAQRHAGRGYYLCPSRQCVADAWKQKKGKTVLKDEKTALELVPAVQDHLLVSVKRLLGRSETAKTTGSVTEGNLRKGDIFLIREDMPGKGREQLEASASTQGADVFHIPSSVLDRSEFRVVRHDSPKISPILRNLRFYEKLSSKGRGL